MFRRISPFLVFALAAAVFVLCVAASKMVYAAEPVPAAVERWRPLVIDATRATFGHTDPAARIGAMLWTESTGRADARSPAGACGLMQFMPATWREQSRITGRFGDCRDPALSVRHGAAYLKRLHGFCRYMSAARRWHCALASYNWGMGSVRRSYRRHGAEWLDHAPVETRRYVPIILRQREPTLILAGWPGVPISY